MEDFVGLGREPAAEPGVRVLYVSPLRALAVDVDKNLRGPLRGITLAAERLGLPFTAPTIGLRTRNQSTPNMKIMAAAGTNQMTVQLRKLASNQAPMVVARK